MLITMRNFDTDKQIIIDFAKSEEFKKAIKWLDEPNLFNEDVIDASYDGSPFAVSPFDTLEVCNCPICRKDKLLQNDAENKKGQPSTLFSFLSALDAIGEINAKK